MPEEIESPTESVEEHIHEAAEHGKDNWLRWCALLTAVLAVMAALSGLIASGYANTAMMEQIRASDQWSFYQAKQIKELITGALKPDEEKQARYRQEEEAIRAEAERLSAASERHMQQHEITARAVTCFQVAIAMIAIVVLTKRRRFILLSVVLGLAGFVFLAMGC